MLACIAVAAMSISPPPAPDSIAGEWDLVHFLEDGRASSPGYRLHQWVDFESDGELTYSDGCNWVSGEYSVDGNGALSITMTWSTARGCERCDLGWTNCERIPPQGWSLPHWMEAVPWEIQGYLLRIYFDEDRSRGAIFRWRSPARASHWRPGMPLPPP
jgi:hypothetical protein